MAEEDFIQRRQGDLVGERASLGKHSVNLTAQGCGALWCAVLTKSSLEQALGAYLCRVPRPPRQLMSAATLLDPAACPRSPHSAGSCHGQIIRHAAKLPTSVRYLPSVGFANAHVRKTGPTLRGAQSLVNRFVHVHRSLYARQLLPWMHATNDEVP